MKKHSFGLLAILLVATLFLTGAIRRPDYGEAIGNYHFQVEIDGVDAGHFTAVDGLSIEQEIIEYQNGDDPLLRKRPGRVKYGNITLKRGYSENTVLNDWIEAARSGNGYYTRKNMSIVLVDNSLGEVNRWNCFECFPASWKISPLENGSSQDYLTEELVVVIEWFEEA